MGRREFDDRGVLSISFAIIFPAILLFVLLVVQAALFWYSQSVALTAAREGADAGRVLNGTDADARTRAQDFLDRFDGLLGTPTVSVPPRKPTDTTITVTVHIQPLLLLPGLDSLDVKQSVTMPIEQFVR